MRFLDILKITAAIVLILFGALIGLGALVDSKPSDMSPLAEMVLVVLFSLVPLFLGVLIIYRVKTQTRHRRMEALEKEILELAKTNGGILSVQDLAMKTRLSLEESKTMLENFFADGWCGIDMDEGGRVIYIFNDLARSSRPNTSA